MPIGPVYGIVEGVKLHTFSLADKVLVYNAVFAEPTRPNTVKWWGGL
jgi:hypothetical protein